MRTGKTWHLQHLLALLASAALLPIALVGAWSIKNALEQQRHEMERSALEISRALATAVNADLESTISSLRTFSRSPALAKGKVAEFYSIAKDALPGHPYWRAIILSDASGKLLFTTSLPYGGTVAKIVDHDSLQRTLQSKAPVVGSVLSGTLGKMAYPVRFPVIWNGNLEYVLSAAVMPDRILDIVKQQKAPSDWVIAVFDSSGKRVARTKDHQNNSASPSLAKLLAQGHPEGIGLTTTLEGIESLTAFTRISNYGWVVAIGIPSAHLYSGLVHNILVFLVGILLSVAAYLVIAGYMARHIANGINELRDQAVSLVRGATGIQAGKSRIKEVNETSDALIALSNERAQIETNRSELLASLNAALDSSRNALLQAEEAAKAKDVFLAMLGHELRNPLAPIVAALDLMDLKGDEATQHEREIMRRQVSHMRRLVDDLLDASRIIQGKLNIRKATINVRDVVQQALHSVEGMAAHTGASIHLAQPEKDIWIEGDASRLIQVLTNLLTNALKFTPGGNIHLTVREKSDCVSIVVADSGVGMTQDTINNMFQPFFQVPQSIARTEGGLGLGLAIVRSIVELHDGSVAALSDGLGKGSRFEINLPRGAGPELHPLQAQGPQNISRKKVLIVDDNADAASLIASGLGFFGHKVQTACSASETLKVFETFRPDAVILDIGMPDMDGYALARMLRTRHVDWTGKLIALTGYGRSKDKAKAAAAGFHLHLTKPISIEELCQALNKDEALLQSNGIDG